MTANLVKNIDSDFSLQNFNLVHKTIQKAIMTCGPVHINIPLNELLYETTTKAISFPKIKKEEKEETSLLDEEPLNVDDLDVSAKS